MNHIFKKIWNKSLGRMVVVSENAKSAGKTDNTTGVLVSPEGVTTRSIIYRGFGLQTLVLSIAMVTGTHVWAGNIVQGITCPSFLSNKTIEMSVGNDITYITQTASAISDSFFGPSVDGAVSIGADCNNQTLALDHAVAIGGAAASANGVAIGSGALARRVNNVALGNQAQALGKNSIALGANSIADRENSFSVGNTVLQRQITNVAAGTQGTDAVNLGQVQSLFSAIGVSANYAHNSSDTALGSTSGIAHATENNGTTLTKVAGISVTSTSTSLDDIDSFTINGITTTKAAAPDKVAAFIQAAKNGGNIAIGTNSSAVGVANIVTSASSTAIGYSNEARGNASVAIGYNNTALMHGASAIGHDNVAVNDYGTSIGVNNYSQNKSSVAVGSNISSLRPTQITTNGLGIITGINGIPVTATGNTTATITHVNGTAVNDTQRQAFLERLQWGGNLALAENSSVLGVGGITLGTNSTAVGYGNTARGANSSALGYLNTSVGQSSTAIGSATSPAGRTPPGVVVTAGTVDAIDGITVVSTATSWADLRDNPTKLTSVNGMEIGRAHV